MLLPTNDFSSNPKFGLEDRAKNIYKVYLRKTAIFNGQHLETGWKKFSFVNYSESLRSRVNSFSKHSRKNLMEV